MQYAVFNLGYSAKELLQNCPKAPDGNEADPSLRRIKCILTHPIGDYAVQPREVCVSVIVYSQFVGSLIQDSYLPAYLPMVTSSENTKGYICCPWCDSKNASFQYYCHFYFVFYISYYHIALLAFGNPFQMAHYINGGAYTGGY